VELLSEITVLSHNHRMLHHLLAANK